MIKTRTSNHTAKALLAELKILARRHRKAKRGYRAVLYSSMGRASRIISQLKKSDALKRKFLLSVNRQSSNQTFGHKSNLSTEVIAIIIGATSRSRRQQAWKYGRVLDVLRIAGVSADDMPKEIPKRGGFEKIYRDSIKKKSSSNVRAKERSMPVVLAVKGQTLSVPQTDSAPQTDADGVGTNNREVLVAVYMNLADRDEILEMPNGTRAKLSIIKIGQPKALLKVRSIKLVR